MKQLSLHHTLRHHFEQRCDSAGIPFKFLGTDPDTGFLTFEVQATFQQCWDLRGEVDADKLREFILVDREKEIVKN